MTFEELKQRYHDDERAQELARSIGTEHQRVALKGLAGSSAALFANGVLHQSTGIHLFILGDKEEAAYFLNDLEALDKKGLHPMFFPSPSRSIYERHDKSDPNIVMRAEVLEELGRRRKRSVIVTYPEALSEYVVTQKTLKANTTAIKRGVEYDLEELNAKLIEQGFEKVDQVYEPGQFSVRGGIVDVFSYSHDHPFRIEFFGDEVDSIRAFNPTDQLSYNKLDRATIVPDVQSEKLASSHQSFMDFLPEKATIWLRGHGLAHAAIEKEYDKAQYLWDRMELKDGFLPPAELYTTPEHFEDRIYVSPVIEFGQYHYEPTLTLHFKCKPQPSFNKNFELLGKDLEEKRDAGYQTLIVSGQARQIERLYAIFEDLGEGKEKVAFTPVNLDLNEGFVDQDLKISCYTDHQIFERYHRFRLKEGFKKNSQALTVKELNQLQKGDLVTHIDHGVGRFDGLEKIEVHSAGPGDKKKEQEAIRIIYKDGDLLYVSIHSLHRIAKYSGKEGSTPRIDKLGSNAWQKLKNKTKKRVKELAFDLIKLYAKRKAKKGFAYAPDTYLQNELEASFIYEDTPDQESSTADVKADMEKDSPMDRLICGDVGFGKTEIAIRAAFKAVADSKQVAVLVPTTILCLQHYKSFKERLGNMPARVDYLNRFRSAKDQTQVLKDLKEGKIDIIISTHKLVGKNVVFKDLGLLIIDEEQKFGVGVKDKLKTLRETVDTLTLTATPIPRTLQFSLMGARDLSIMTTPPPNRHPVQTELHPFNEAVFKEAIEYEVSRGGQVFFVHNRVKNIEEVAEMVRRLCPGVRVCTGHGQMDGPALERVMLDFIEGVYDVLVATTIIESGIDIPNANTIIINEAHHFGLSDLHQLRGRVGRSNKKAFCYLVAPPMQALTTEARRRLTAIEQFSDLGSGMNIAMRDLDIRGAGNLLGSEQSGFINEVGFEMYHKILDEAIEELKEEQFKDLFKDEGPVAFVKDCQIDTDMELLIPDDYVNEIAERLSLYRELDEVKDKKGLEVFREKMVDRFGPLPKETAQLLQTIELRWLAAELGFEKLVLKNERLIGHFVANQESPFYQSPAFTGILEVIKQNPPGVKMYEKNGGLRLGLMDITDIKKALDILSEFTDPQRFPKVQ